MKKEYFTFMTYVSERYELYMLDIRVLWYFSD